MARNVYCDLARTTSLGLHLDVFGQRVGCCLAGVALIVVGIDSKLRHAGRDPHLLHVGGTEGGPYGLTRSHMHRQRGLDAFRDGELVRWLEEPYRRPLDA